MAIRWLNLDSDIDAVIPAGRSSASSLSKRRWFVKRNGVKQGPFPSAEIRRRAKKGLLLPTDLLWERGMTKWTPAGLSPKLFPDGPVSDADYWRFDTERRPVTPRRLAFLVGIGLIIGLAATFTIARARGSRGPARVYLAPGRRPFEIIIEGNGREAPND